MRGCFSHSFNGRTEVIHSTKTWQDRQLSILLLFSDTKTFSF
ncbi:hypothetical protein HMPREF9141_2024 [Prevotella multiformis DSM 16608]|uniref:Uncharacterized protein n=1 Tax=Prevotella multiformis DSM 16608 TaxID=888743 RepID=F0F8V7_9BACT|nr:hypothetical protein HMPREF9141_2024 [Prevotella multiformis DSM 16608]